MSAVAQFLLLAAIDVAGLFAIWFILRARVGRYLELENLLSGVREEARGLVTELNETADRNVSLVEDRMRSLRELLDEADRRMGLVRRELGTRAAEREVYDRLNKRRPIVPSEAQSATTSASAQPQSPQQPQQSQQPQQPQIEAPIAFALGQVPEVKLSGERIEVAKTVREQALELYGKGFSAQIIAARIGATVAEIELMIEMEERRSAAR
jgi:hypothetical protein